MILINLKKCAKLILDIKKEISKEHDLANIRRIVLDVLKPHTPNMVEIAKQLADIRGVDGVDVSLKEMDQKVENVKITCEGESINFEEIEKVIIENGATIHSLDKVSSGTSLIEEVTTQQD